MIVHWMKTLLVTTVVSTTLIGCGGGGGGGDSTSGNKTTNNLPVIAGFSTSINNEDGSVEFSWDISDPDNDSLTCSISLGDNTDTQELANCASNNTFSHAYSASGTYIAVLNVADAAGSVERSVKIELQLVDPSLPEPVVSATDGQMVVFYNRSDDDYADWILHLWNNENCNAYSDYAADAGSEWATGVQSTGIDPNYGAYWVISTNTDADCANFIVHKGDEKDIGGADLRANLVKGNMIWTLSGFPDLFYVPTAIPEGVRIENTAAHWATADTLFLAESSASITKVRVYSSDVDELGFDGETGISGDNYIEFYPQTSGTHPATSLDIPRYKDLAAFTADSVDIAKAKQMLTGKLLAIAYAGDSVVSATYVQTPKVIDALYTQASNDANEATLGLIYSDSAIVANLWSPTAKQVTVKVFNDNKVLQTSYEMSVSNDSGVWSTDLPLSVDRQFYQYEINVFHAQNQRFETVTSTDPYSVSLSTNGNYSQFVNLNDDDLKPLDWDGHAVPEIDNFEDTMVYEGHIRDFSIRDESTSVENRGKYLAFTETDSAPVKHLQALANSGLTHFQFLPVNDIASIGEDSSDRVNINNTVAELCAVASNAPVCGVESNDATLLSVYESYDPSSTDAQALAQSLRGLDSFNWGYDPEHFNTPDGSYASNSDGVARIIEMRSMNKALHDIGLRVVLDVVYNHTSTSGLWENSVLDKVVPGYYHRRDLITGNVENATCCQDTAPEHEMMQKLMVDSLMQWTSAYKFDGFRFDIMSNNSVESITSARAAVQAIDPDNYFYGEGWTRADKGYVQADQNNIAGMQVGTFNDRPRDIIRSASLFQSSGSLNDQDIIRLGLAGTQANYLLEDQSGNVKSGKNFSQSAYGKDPADIINYVSKHDNETLWDQLQYGLPTGMARADRVRVQNIAATIPLLSQGIPFFQLGGDLLRSKSMDRNTYDAGDWFNYVDFTKTTNNWNVGLPLAEDNEAKWSLMSALNGNANISITATDIQLASDVFKDFVAIRSASPLFRLTTTADIIDRVGFHNTGSSQTQGLIVMSLDDGLGLTDLDTENDAIVVVINGSAVEQSHTIVSANDFELNAIQQISNDSVVKTSTYTQGVGEGTFTVPAYTTAVFVKPQSGAQGQGLAADATLNAPDIAPYGDTEIYLSGSMNNWGSPSFTSGDTFTYQGNGIYSLSVDLAVGTHTFAITDLTESIVDLGFNEVDFTADSVAASADVDGNIVINLATASNYQFSLNAAKITPELSIISKVETINCALLPDSADAIPFDIAGSGELYVRGSHSGWNAEEQFRLHYKGNNVYQAVADFDGDFEFKLASDDGSWTTQLWVPQAAGNDINTDNLDVGITYPIAYEGTGTSNNQTILPQGQYSFLLTLDSANPSKDYNVGSLIIQQCE
ncbi:DUF3372 domain-containing protein [Thalassotalea psychrophila]|uniref:DUF3372 domain-containing protein n=1 Tax=Thalassotalea psychrophila TaxID=3065647 RepID=A0ABY9TTZ0_9GAMM|nr:DUF3372 domain-containing protein [Colwelliaceae bacterium SQ149]